MPLRNQSPIVDWLIETLGPLRAFEAFMEFGGTRHYVPMRSDGKCRTGRLSRFFTAMELELFVRRWAGEYITFPVGREHCVLVLYWHCGESFSNIARALRMSENGVWRATRGQPPVWLNPRTAARRTHGRPPSGKRSATQPTINELLGLSAEDVKRFGSSER